MTTTTNNVRDMNFGEKLDMVFDVLEFIRCNPGCIMFDICHALVGFGDNEKSVIRFALDTLVRRGHVRKEFRPLKLHLGDSVHFFAVRYIG